MSWPTPYVLLPGTAREALTFYAEVFGGTLVVNTYEDFGRTDGPGDAVAHGMLQGPVSFFASDASAQDRPLQTEGLMQSLLGAADPDTARRWFAALSEGGTVVDELQVRPWGASDGQVIDRFGMHWLLGFEEDPDA